MQKQIVNSIETYYLIIKLVPFLFSTLHTTIFIYLLPYIRHMFFDFEFKYFCFLNFSILHRTRLHVRIHYFFKGGLII